MSENDTPVRAVGLGWHNTSRSREVDGFDETDIDRLKVSCEVERLQDGARDTAVVIVRWVSIVNSTVVKS